MKLYYAVLDNDCQIPNEVQQYVIITIPLHEQKKVVVFYNPQIEESEKFKELNVTGLTIGNSLTDLYDLLVSSIRQNGGKWIHEDMLKLFLQCVDVSIAKNKDYASDNDPFSNFRLAAQMGLCSVPVSMLVRSCDKFRRICNLISKPNAVKGESIFDSILDLIVYMALLYVYLDSKQKIADEIKEEINKLLEEQDYNVEGFSVVYHIDKDKFEILVLGDRVNHEFYNKVKEICKQKDVDFYFNNFVSNI